MAKVANTWLFRAEAMRLSWSAIASGQLAQGRGRNVVDRRPLQRVKGRDLDIHVWWACAKELGVPRAPFVVWTRTPGDKLQDVAVREVSTDDGSLVTWGGDEAACVQVTFRPVDAGLPSALLLYRTSDSVWEVVGAQTAPAGSGDPTTLQVRTSGATLAKVVNGTDVRVLVAPLRDVVNDDSWKPLEVVGLPCDQPWAATAYDSGPQGALTNPLTPIDAAIDRVTRGAPPLGWWPLSQAGRAMPPWVDPDPSSLVKEVRRDLLPELEAMYDRGVPEPTQYLLESQRAVAGPQQGSRSSSLDTSATIRPFSLLALPAQTDPLLNLATGFGATYFVESGSRPEFAVGNADFLVTAEYERMPAPIKKGSTMAAYAPLVGPHVITPAPVGLATERSGLVAPIVPDAPWRESIRLSWARVPSTAGLGRVASGALARYPSAGGTTELLLPQRDSGGWRLLALSPDGVAGEPGNDRVAFADGAAEIPIGGGGRQVGYCVSVVDIHGVWSPWRDKAYAGDEPGPLAPRLISLTLDSAYAGSPACPASLVTEVALDWTERTPTGLQLVAIFYPTAAGNSDPPAGVDPGLPVPAGCFRRDLSLAFVGDVPTATGCAVTPMDSSGEHTMSPGPGQGDGGRRYVLRADVPSLDFGSTNRWGVQVWARSSLVAGASPTGWFPDAAHPARAIAASPVPVQPIPPPLPPGVPMGSTPDSHGCSHVRVHWSLPGGPAVRTCIVWEIAETALRQRAGLATRAPETDSPGVRLAALWSAYDAMSDNDRRSSFRRLLEVDGSLRDADVTLPKGSTDIHLFAVTTQSMTGVESPWPSAPGVAHEHLQAVMAPRLRSPAPPVARATVAEDGTVTMSLSAASTVSVAKFLVFATTSESAARDRETMGPAVATVPVTLTPTTKDPLTGADVYTAEWTGTLAPHWDPWLVRAVAQPVDAVPVEAVRGVPSPASEVLSLWSLPPDGPDLAPLTGSVWGSSHKGVHVRSSTTALVRATAFGSHRLTASAGAVVLPMVALADLAETLLTSAPPAATSSVVAERGARLSGQTPLAVWFTRPVAADPVDVTLRLVDPLGRAVERTLTVPGWVPPPPQVTLTIDSITVQGQAVLLGVSSNASRLVSAGYVMEVLAVQGGGRSGPVLAPAVEPVLVDPAALGPAGLSPAVIRRPPVGIGAVVPPNSLARLRHRGHELSGSFALSHIRTTQGFFPSDGEIHVARPSGRRRRHESTYLVWVPLGTPVRVDVSVVGPDGSRVTATSTA